MPPQNRQTGKPANEIKVEPASAASPRARGGLPKKQVEAAVEKSAEFLESQAAPPTDVHPKPTTPTKAEVEAAVARSAEHLEGQGFPVDTSASGVSPAAKQAAVVSPPSAAPVAAGLANPSLSAAPVSGARDKTQDAAPVFSAPVPDKPKEDE